MCGRYTLTAPGEIVAELFELVDVPPILPRYNLAPTQEAAVVRIVKPGAPRTLAALRWGLVPYWAQDPAIGNRLINARAESLADKPAYRDSFRRRRCLVPADGFYEWKKLDAKVKQPYHIHRQDRRPFAFAGLWDSWRSPGPESARLETFTIITTDPNGLVRPLHDRMPVILDPRDYAAWLDPANRNAAQLRSLLAPSPDASWEATPVSRAVNHADHDAPDCIEPLVSGS